VVGAHSREQEDLIFGATCSPSITHSRRTCEAYPLLGRCNFHQNRFSPQWYQLLHLHYLRAFQGALPRPFRGTLDVNANGILSASAADKPTGKSDRIIINDEGRPLKYEIERILHEVGQ